MMSPRKIFEKELGAISNEMWREIVAQYLDHHVPGYFYEIPASQTGKYHPWYSLGYAGLVRHTKAAVLIAVDLLNLEQNKENNNLPADEIIIALIIHDTFKCGTAYNGHTEFNHPLLAAQQFENFVKDRALEYPKIAEFIKNRTSLNLIMSLVSSHMGQWNVAPNKLNTLPKPETEAQQFVHMCDYLASRKYITVEVE